MRLVYPATAGDEGRKVYHVLKNTLALSAQQIKRLKRAGAVYVDGESVFMDRRLVPGETLEADLAAGEAAPEFPPEDGDVDVIYENGGLLAVNKPSGMLTHPSRGKFTGTLANYVSGYVLKKYSEPNVHCVNRLDRDTSGVVLFARNAHFKNLAVAALREPEAEKVYLAYLAGELPEKRGVIDLPIDREREGAQKRVVRDTGKRAVTEYEVLRRAVAGESVISEVRLSLRTGRTHQIRVHCAYLGAPVIGDRLYGDSRSVALAEGLGVTGTLLHAAALKFREPLSKDAVTLTAPVNRQEMMKMGEIFRDLDKAIIR